MDIRNLKNKAIYVCILLVLVPNIVFFIWRSNNDPLIAYQSLMTNCLLLSSGLAFAFIVSIFSVNNQLQLSQLDIWVSIFTILILINLKGSYNEVIFDKNLLSYFISIGIYAVIRVYKKEVGSKKLLFILLFIILSIELMFVAVELFSRIEKHVQLTGLVGSFDNSGKLGIYLSLFYPSLLYTTIQAYKTKSFAYKIILVVCLMLLFIFLILSFSRIAWVAVFICTAIIGFWYIQSSKSKIKFLLVAVTSFALLAQAILFIKQDSANGRLLIWNISFSHLKPYWLKGAGYGKFPSLYNLWQSDYFSHREILDSNFYIADNTFFAFNELLQSGIELGWLGTLLWIVLFGYMLLASFKKNIWALSSIAFLIACLASYPFREAQHQLLFFIFLALFANSKIGLKNHVGINIKKRLSFILLTVLYFIPLVCFGYAGLLCFRQYQSTLKWKMARVEFPFDERQGLAFYNEAKKEMKYNPEFLLEYATRLAEIDSTHAAIESLYMSKKYFVSQLHLIELGYCYEKLQIFSLAERYYKEAIYVSPSKLLPRYQLLQLCEKNNYVTEGVVVAKDIIKIKLKVSSDETGKKIKQIGEEFLTKFGGIKN